MNIARFELAQRSNARRRAVGRMAIIGLLATSSIFLLQPNAFASNSGLSSTILANPVPGLVPIALGAENGPITQSNVGVVLGSNEGPSSVLGQSLADGAVTAYIRSWNHQPSNGDALVIAAFQFKYASDENAFMSGLDTQIRSQADQAGNAALTVAGIPGAAGAELHTSSSGAPQSEYVVSFVKGNTAFQEVIATASGDLTSADAMSVASQQYAAAPDIPADSSGTSWHFVPGVALVGLALFIGILVIGRHRKYPAALTPQDGHVWGTPAVSPAGPWAAYSSTDEQASKDQRPKVSADQ